MTGIIQRSLVRLASEHMAQGRTALVAGPPRSGLSTMAAQTAASSPQRAGVIDARSPEWRAMAAAAAGVPAGLGGTPLIVLDNARDEDARALIGGPEGPGSSAGPGAMLGRRPRIALFGGPFPSFRGRTGAATLLKAGPLSLFEVGAGAERRLWLRGGYPEAFGAASDGEAASWLGSYAADIARGRLGDALPVRDGGLALRGLEAVAAAQGIALNENALARTLGVSRPTVQRALTGLEEAGLLVSLAALPRELAPGAARPARSARLYVRDSGLVHALLAGGSQLGLGSQLDAAAGAARATLSWRGFVVSQALEALPSRAELCHYASADGAVLELVALRDGRPRLAATVSRHRPLSTGRSAAYAARALGLREPGTLFVVYPDGEDRPLQGGFVGTGLPAFLDRIRGL